jgi:hypothetical protein
MSSFWVVPREWGLKPGWPEGPRASQPPKWQNPSMVSTRVAFFASFFDSFLNGIYKNAIFIWG